MPHFIGQLAFALLLGTAVFLFARRIGTIRRNIKLGRDIDLTDRPGERWATMARVALGQSKMVVRPVAGVMHILIYVGFILINIEVLEILFDGLFGTHRAFAPFLGGLYDVMIGAFEWLALGVWSPAWSSSFGATCCRLPVSRAPKWTGGQRTTPTSSSWWRCS